MEPGKTRRARVGRMVMNSALTKQEQVRLIVDQTSLLGDPWQSYEAGKAQLQGMELSPAEYEQAIKRLAETLGI